MSTSPPSLPPPPPPPPQNSSTDPSSSPSNSSPYRVIVLISGSGTNLQALIDACNTTKTDTITKTDEANRTGPSSSPPSLPNTRIIRVLSNRRDAYGLTRAAAAGIPTTYHNLLTYKKKHANTEAGTAQARLAYDADLAALIVRESPDLVVCAGFMHILSPAFLAPLAAGPGDPISIINLHPALPGQFNGAGAIARAWQAFQRGEIAATGVMVHRVVAEVDMGEPLVVREVEMRVGESEFELEKRIHEIEWGVIVEGTRRALEEIGERRRSSRITAAPVVTVESRSGS